MMNGTRQFFFRGLLLALAIGFASSATAIPVLQIYIDGATYDSATETWVVADSTFDLWVMGDVGSYGAVSDLKLSAAVDSSETGSVTLTPGTTSVITDPSTPIAPIASPLSADGAIPQLSDGSDLPTHGIYGPGVSFYEWALGDLTLMDSPMGDYIDAFPTSFPSSGQVNVYEVTVDGYTVVHFDAYDNIVAGGGRAREMQHAKFAPFSHDGELVPEPSGLLLFSVGMLVVGGAIRRR